MRVSGPHHKCSVVMTMASVAWFAALAHAQDPQPPLSTGLEVYGRTSFVFGQFNTSYEYAPGVKWYPLHNHRVWLVAEGLRIVKSPLSSVITPYTSGFTG
jgi:hypothetical protein